MKQNKKGFTLTEILVVVLIIGILSTIAVPQYMTTVVRTRIASNLPLAVSMQEAIVRYFASKNEAPSTLAKLSIQLPQSFTVDGLEATSENPNCKMELLVEMQDGTNLPKEMTFTCQTTPNINDWRFRFEFNTSSIGVTEGKRYFEVFATDATTLVRLNKAARAMGWTPSTTEANANKYEIT